MSYDPEEIIRSYTENAASEDQAEKSLSLRTEIPREYIKRYINPSDKVLDAGGGVGINAIMMAGMCESVTLLDITPQILELARENINSSGPQDRIQIVMGGIERVRTGNLLKARAVGHGFASPICCAKRMK